MSTDFINYNNKRVLVIGAATGMGAAAAMRVAALGADVIAMDIAEVSYPTAQTIVVDLSSQTSVDSALAAIETPIDAIFSCAGVADGVPTLLQINFISQRYIIETLAASGRIKRGGAVVMISSAGGLPWQKHTEQLSEFLATETWQDSLAWAANHSGSNSYSFSKQAMCMYVAQQALPMLKQGLRINSVMPGPTDTPLARANADQWLGFGASYREAAGIDALTPLQIANNMIYLCSDAASGVNGINLLVDAGHISAAMTGAYHDEALALLNS